MGDNGRMRKWFCFKEVESQEKYCLLGFIKGVVKLSAWLSLCIGVILFFVILIFGGGPDAPRITSLFGLLLGIIYFFMLYILACFIEIGVNIEANTKKATLLLGGRESK